MGKRLPAPERLEESRSPEANLAQRIRGAFKPREVEELVDYYLHRPLAGLLVQLLLPYPVQPNHLTVAAGIAGILAGGATAYGAVAGGGWLGVGALCLLVSIVLDCADGQLARHRGSASLSGRILDGLTDGVVVTAAFLGQVAFLISRGYGSGVVLAVGTLTAVSLLWHAGQYDAAKNLYVQNAHPKFELGDQPSSAEVEQLRLDHVAQGDRFEAALLWLFDRLWLRPQARGGTPSVPTVVEARTGGQRLLFRTLYRGNMRLWSWLGLGTHMFLFAASIALSAWDARSILLVWAIVLGPMNLLCGVLLAQRGRLHARLTSASKRNRGSDG